MADNYRLTERDWLNSGLNEFGAKAIAETSQTTVQNTTDIGENTTSIEQLQGRVDTLEGQVQNLQTQVGQLQVNVTQLQNDVTQLQNDVSTLQTDLQQVQTDLTDLTDRVDTAESNITQLQTDLNALTNRVSTNEQSISDAENEIIDIQLDILDLQNQQSSYQNQSSAITIPANGSLDVFTYANVATGLHGITAMCDTIDADVTLNVTVNAVSAFSLPLTERTVTPQIPANMTAAGVNTILTLTNSSASPKNVSPFVALSVLRF